jgi:hypothetical protein
MFRCSDVAEADWLKQAGLEDIVHSLQGINDVFFSNFFLTIDNEIKEYNKYYIKKNSSQHLFDLI